MDSLSLIDWYDREGNPIKNYKKIDKLLTTPAYKIVKQETLANGVFVSTVWLGLNHRFGTKGAPLIFETMVFPKRGEWGDIDCERYTTEAKALVGHKKMVNKHS